MIQLKFNVITSLFQIIAVKTHNVATRSIIKAYLPLNGFIFNREPGLAYKDSY